MAKLNDETKLFIVQCPACFDTPSQIVGAKTEALVRSEAVRSEVRSERGVLESEIIEANAILQANLIRTHRG